MRTLFMIPRGHLNKKHGQISPNNREFLEATKSMVKYLQNNREFLEATKSMVKYLQTIESSLMYKATIEFGQSLSIEQKNIRYSPSIYWL